MKGLFTTFPAGSSGTMLAEPSRGLPLAFVPCMANLPRDRVGVPMR
jgi:hypothetical protein